jgi:predicted DNA-binding protein YlxM (UPF0122 family)
MEIVEKLRLNNLYDIYGELLTEKQRMYFEYYYLQDYSLSEISDILNVSRNAVHMQLKNVVIHLENYESKLSILKNKKHIKKIIDKINKKELTLEDVAKELEKV